MFRKKNLRNGLRIITIPQNNTQAVTVLVLVGTGSKYETKRISGISHFLEHMFFKGTRKRPSTIAIAETLDRVGGIYNAFTGEEYTGYYAKVGANHIDLALDWVSDIFLNSKLETKEIRREKSVIFEEINMHFDNPLSFIQILWSRLLYGDQPAGWDIAGSKESVAAISRKKLLDYMKTQYVAPNVIVCIAGKIKNSKAEENIGKYFAGVKTSPSIRKNPVIEKQEAPACLLHQRKTDQTHFCLGVRGYNFFHPQKYAQQILGAVLGGMMSSRLFIKVRERLGLAYYITTNVSSDTDTGYLVTQVGIDNRKVELGIRTILREYKRISEKEIPQQELEKAKEYIKGKMALLLESSDAQASFFSLQELLEGKIFTLKEIYDKIDKVSAKDVLSVAKDLFQPQKLNLTVLGPFKSKKLFQKKLIL